MGAAAATAILSHWNHMVEGLQQSSDAFYAQIEQLLGEHNLKDTNLSRVNLSEGGILSAKREYLQVRRKEHVFHVCAAPFGNGFFVSWWLGEIESGLFAWLTSLPYIGGLFNLLKAVAKPLTYYRVDTALMFQSVTHGAVLEALESVIDAKGLRALSDVDRKPTMKGLFDRLG